MKDTGALHQGAVTVRFEAAHVRSFGELREAIHKRQAQGSRAATDAMLCMSATGHSSIRLGFSDCDLFVALEAALRDPVRFDELDFGVVAMDSDGTVLGYNRPESDFSGISADHCIGLNFFTNVAPCTNNYLVAGRFEEESNPDETIDYVFTLKMRTTRVQLRLLKAEPSPHQYLLVQRR